MTFQILEMEEKEIREKMKKKLKKNPLKLKKFKLNIYICIFNNNNKKKTYIFINYFYDNIKYIIIKQLYYIDIEIIL